MQEMTGNELRKELRKKRREFYLQFLDSGDVYFDVGANFGNRIDPIIDDGISIVAIEPQPKCIKKLKRKFGNRITLITKGVGAKKDVMTMFLAKAHTISTFSKDFIKDTQESGRFSKYKWEKEIEVEVETLDNIISEYGKPTFMKIDVEGFEAEVLAGLSQPIQSLSFEYLASAEPVTQRCLEQIESLRAYEYNVTIGERRALELAQWRDANGIRQWLAENTRSAGSGDIYARHVPATKSPQHRDY